jgi:hydroxymethylglutaryl-CoA lyase
MSKSLRYSTKLLPSFTIRSRNYATHFPGEQAQSRPFVKIVECGARDGLQNELGTVDVQTKVELIEQLGEAGLSAIESGAMVSKKGVPQVRAPAKLTSIK